MGKEIQKKFTNKSYEEEQEKIAKILKALSKKGFRMGKLKFKSRDELYDRKY